MTGYLQAGLGATLVAVRALRFFLITSAPGCMVRACSTPSNFKDDLSTEAANTRKTIRHFRHTSTCYSMP